MDDGQSSFATVMIIFNRTCVFSTVSTLLLLTMASMQLCLLQTNILFPLHLSESQGRFNLDQICQNSEAKMLCIYLTLVSVCMKRLGVFSLLPACDG